MTFKKSYTVYLLFVLALLLMLWLLRESRQRSLQLDKRLREITLKNK